MAALASDNDLLRTVAATSLGEIGDARAVEPLMAALASDNDLLRTAAAASLGEIGDARAVEPLMAALASDNDLLRTAAAASLGKIGDARAVELLIEALTSANASLRIAAAGSLIKIGDARADEPLMAALEDRQREVREYVAFTLGSLGDERAVLPLCKFLKDVRDPFDPHEAHKAIFSTPNGMHTSTATHDHAFRTMYSRDVRVTVAAILGRIGDPRAVDTLCLMLDPKKHSTLGYVSVGGQEWLTVAAAEALGNIQDARAIEPILAALRDTDPIISVYRFFNEPIITALTKIGLSAVEPLIAALKAPEEIVRYSSAQALGGIGDTRAVGPLIITLTYDVLPMVRAAAAEGLRRLGDKSAIDPLTAKLGAECVKGLQQLA